MSVSRWIVGLSLTLGSSGYLSNDHGCSPYFVGVGDLAGDTFLSITSDVTSNGKFVVGGSNSDDPSVPNDGDSAGWQHASQAFRWSSPCTHAPQLLEGLGYPFTGVHQESNAKGIAPDGQYIAGDATYGPSIPTTFKPVLWTAPGAFTELERVPGHASGSAADVSRSSQGPGSRLVVGYSTTASNHAHRVPGAVPVYWAFPSLSPLQLPFPAGVSAEFGEARCVSGNGRVIAGNLYHFVNGLVESTACVWIRRPGHHSGDFMPYVLAQPPGKASGWVTGISDDGRVIAGYGFDDLLDFDTNTPCLWRSSGPPPTMTFGPPEILPMLPGATGGAAGGVNGDGRVIGGQCIVADATHAVRWSGPGLTTVEDVLVSAAAHGLDPGTWTLWYVSRLSNDGKTMVGTGDHLDDTNMSVIEGWAAEIPIP